MKPSEHIEKRAKENFEDQGIHRLTFAILEFLDEHAHVFESRPVEEREVTVERCRHCGLEWTCPECDGAPPSPIPEGAEEFRNIDKLREEHSEALENDPKERGDGDALEMLESMRNGLAYSEVPAVDIQDAIAALNAERARHADEVERLKENSDSLLKVLEDVCVAVGFSGLIPRANIATEVSKRLRAEKAEAEAAELREKLEALEPACRFSETLRLDARQVSVQLALNPRFIGHHCRITIEALFPIGEPAEVSKPEGRDA